MAAYEFKRAETGSLVAEDVEILNVLGLSVVGEIVAEDPNGYFVRVSQEGGQEYFIPRSSVIMITARSRKVGGTVGA